MFTHWPPIRWLSDYRALGVCVCGMGGRNSSPPSHFFSFLMKNDAITFLRADLRVQITSLKRVIRRLLKKEGRSEEGNKSRHICGCAWLYVYLHMRMRILMCVYRYIFKWKTDRSAVIRPEPLQAGRWEQSLNLKQHQPKERRNRERHESLQGKVIYAQSRDFPSANWLSYPGLIHFSRSPSPSHPEGIYPYFAFSTPAAAPSPPGAPHGRGFAGTSARPRLVPRPRKGRRSGGRPRGRGVAAGSPPGFRVPSSAPSFLLFSPPPASALAGGKKLSHKSDGGAEFREGRRE